MQLIGLGLYISSKRANVQMFTFWGTLSVAAFAPDKILKTLAFQLEKIALCYSNHGSFIVVLKFNSRIGI